MTAEKCEDCGRRKSESLAHWFQEHSGDTCAPVDPDELEDGDDSAIIAHADCQNMAVIRLRAQLAAANARLAESDADLMRCAADVKLLFIRAGEGRALLQRMVKYIREDKATTPGTTRLARLTEQVADYMKRTHDPNSILRGVGA